MDSCPQVRPCRSGDGEHEGAGPVSDGVGEVSHCRLLLLQQEISLLSPPHYPTLYECETQNAVIQRQSCVVVKLAEQ